MNIGASRMLTNSAAYAAPGRAVRQVEVEVGRQVPGEERAERQQERADHVRRPALGDQPADGDEDDGDRRRTSSVEPAARPAARGVDDRDRRRDGDRRDRHDAGSSQRRIISPATLRSHSPTAVGRSDDRTVASRSARDRQRCRPRRAAVRRTRPRSARRRSGHGRSGGRRSPGRAGAAAGRGRRRRASRAPPRSCRRR